MSCKGILRVNGDFDERKKKPKRKKLRKEEEEEEEEDACLDFLQLESFKRVKVYRWKRFPSILGRASQPARVQSALKFYSHQNKRNRGKLFHPPFQRS
ncbi:hypothetical protein M0802_012778 [Mischocyttarus mexicanus]|nr:hypothetical protein M0802_012778 [Mischocyttarus mexicanus]